MSEDSVAMHGTGCPDSAFSAAISKMGNCDVHSNDVIELAVDSGTGDAQSNENWNVHSTAKDCDVHPNSAIEPTADGAAGDVQSNESWNVHSTASACDAHFKDALLSSTATPTLETAAQLQRAFDYLNSELFENKLPHCLILYQRRNGTYGYFAEKRFGREDGKHADEIAINPQHLADRTIEENLSTLAHEVVHLWQHHSGKPGRGRYHNKQWADQMERIGLIPSSTGKEGGKRTGDHVRHFIKPGGAFALAVEKLLATGFTLTWREVPVKPQVSAGGETSGEAGSQSGRRIKFTCPDCGRNAWGKADLNLFCGYHHEKPKMLPADSSPATVAT
jgi:predicted SprT family Zn-dependent metalloprotease